MIKKFAAIALLFFLSVNVVVAKSSSVVSENPYARENLNLTPSKSSYSRPPCQPVVKPFKLSYASSRSSTKPINKDSYVSKELPLSRFNAITVIGNIDVDIDGSVRQQRVEVAGRQKSVQSLVIYTEGSTLYVTTLSQGQRMVQRPRVRINASHLSQFKYEGGASCVNIRNLSPRYPICCMSIQGSPRVTMSGNFQLKNLIVGGSSQVLIYWINSCDFCLQVRDRASVCVGGVATTFEATTCGCGRINAKYLHTKRVFAKSYDCSRIDLRANCALNALASDGSAIYFYQNPKFQAPFMQGAGSVIQMTDLCCPPCGICDNACCKNGWH